MKSVGATSRYESKLGVTIGYLTFVSIDGARNEKDGNRVLGLFRCVCLSERLYPVSRVLSGFYRQHCGCKTDTGSNRTHGMKGSPEYSSWQAMKARCLDTGNKDYPRWGGVGITICGDWIDSFEAFFAHVGARPSGTTLDRIKPELGYWPGNVRWVTPKQQARNRRDLVVVDTPRGRMPLVDYAQILGISKGAAHLRLKRGKLEGAAHV